MKKTKIFCTFFLFLFLLSFFNFHLVESAPTQDNTQGIYFDDFSDLSGLSLNEVSLSNESNLILSSISQEFFEDFTTTFYKDISTTANWDANLGKVFLSDDWIKMNGEVGYDNLSNNNDLSEYPQIQLDTNNYPYIVWQDNTSGNYEIYFTHWNGSNWVKMNGEAGYDNLSNNGGDSENPQIQLDTNNYPYIVWDDLNIYFTHWNGSNWVKMNGEVGYDDLSTYGSTGDYPQMRLDTNNYPYIVWTYYNNPPGNEEIYFTHWNGSDWVKMNGEVGYDNLSNNSGNSWGPQIQLDTNNYPYIVWDDKTSGNAEIYFTHWNGSDWVKMNGEVGYDNLTNNNLYCYYPQIRLDTNDYPYIVWQCDWIYFTHWNGSNWTKMDGTEGYDVLYGWSPNGQIHIQLDTNNYPYIVWEDGDWSYCDIYFTHWSRSTSALAQSTKINLEGVGVVGAVLTANASTTPETDISYQLSVDGGAHWVNVTSTEEYIFTTPGDDLRWRAVLTTTNASIIPEIDSLSISYSYYPTSTKQSVISSSITPSEVGAWDKIVVNNLLNGQAITYQVLDENGNLIPDSVLPGNSTGFSASDTSTTIDLLSLNGSDYSSIKVKADLSTSSSTTTPEILSWKAYWIKAKGNIDKTIALKDETINFDASDSIGSDLTYYWDFDSSDGLDWDNPDATGPVVSHTYSQPGGYTVTLRVKQGEHTAIDEKTFSITIQPESGSEANYPNSLILDVDKDILLANGEDISNLSALTLIEE